ncbi:MAG: dihydrolipoyl dehydrogenase, partial [Syntrophales bacterium LBB04]|nr:dihydrolipoyl dehydrogenase [Syntrophales bacterium LBB04]
MEPSQTYDVAIIGAGPGGYVAGIRAAQLGLTACVIEKDKAGGVCLNWGCIPSKNLLYQAAMFDSRKELESIGVVVDANSLDYSKVQKKSRQATQRLVKGVEFLLKKNNVTLITGTAKIADKNRVVLQDGTEIATKNILIATGSRPFELPGFEFDENRVLSSNGILAMTALPKSLIILGAGAIGCEFAYLMTAFGVKVTLVEMADHILSFEDEETVSVLAQSFKKKGIGILTGTRAVSLSRTDSAVEITIEEKDGTRKTLQAEKALCVFGRTPNTDAVGLENIGIRTDRRYIPVGDYGQTVVPGVYAIGDVVNTPLLAHVASKEGEIAVEHMAGHPTSPRIDINEIPSAIYCEPQLASFGLRETQAIERKIPYKKAIFPYRGIGKAVAIGKPDGMLKILYDPDTQEILGAHIVGHDATELIHEILLAKTARILPAQVALMIHAHPTISGLVMGGMRAVGGHPVLG